MERLQRVIAARGISSRRSAEELITSGRVLVNGVPVTELGTRVDATADEIQVDGKVLRPQRLRTILLNKPAGYITTMQDERERRTVMDLIDSRERLFPVGRLDRDTEGLLLLTNDGELANRIMHPRYRLAKEYHVLTNARPSDRTLQYLRDGVRIDTRDVVPDEIRLLRETREGIWIRIVIHEGFYHAVRRIMEAANIGVLRLRRQRIGPISLSGLEVGQYRDLTPGEMSQISEAVHLDRDAEQTAPALSPPTVPATARTPSGRGSARQGRARLTSERTRTDGRGAASSPTQATASHQRPSPRPAARPRTDQESPVDPPRSPIVERPGAWSARRPEPAPTRPSRADATPRRAASATDGAAGQGRPVPPAPASAPVPSSATAPMTAPPPAGRFETVGGRQFSEVTRTFHSDRPASERRPTARPQARRPRHDAPAAGARRPSRGPEAPPPADRRGGSGRGDSPSQRRAGAGNSRDATSVRRAPGDDRRPFGSGRARTSDPVADRRPPAGGGRPASARPAERASESRGPRPPGGAPAGPIRPTGPDPSGRPSRPRRPERRPDGPAQAGRPLETIGRQSRKVASDNPDEAPTRIKRRSPHPHSHRGRKPKPAAPKINTTKTKSTRTTPGKGNRRGRRR